MQCTAAIFLGLTDTCCNCTAPTKGKFLSRIGGQCEAKDCHGGNEHARDYQVEEVVHLGMQAIDKCSFPEAQNESIFVNVCGCLKALYRSSPNLDDECDVQIWLWTTIVDHLVSHGRHSWTVKSDQLRLCMGGILNYTWGKTIKSDHVWGKSWTMFGGKSSKVTNWDYVWGKSWTLFGGNPKLC